MDGHITDEENPWASSDDEDSQNGAATRPPKVERLCIDETYFHTRSYDSKADITRAVMMYHFLIKRSYTIIESNRQRFMATCEHHECPFVVRFAFKSTFSPPTRFHQHTCNISNFDSASRYANRLCHAKQIAADPDARNLFVVQDHSVTPLSIHEVLIAKGLCASYKNRLRAKQRILTDLFGSSKEQYELLPGYAAELSKKGYHGILEVGERIGIVYREGVHSFEHYAARGLVLDGAHLKSDVGETLLVACFKNGNDQIQIVSVAVVSIENGPNWSWFVKMVLSQMVHPPAFFMSDQEKGLSAAI